MDNYINQVVDNIPSSIKDLNIWLCYDDRDKSSYVNYDSKKIEEYKKRPRDLKGIFYKFNQRCFTFNECIDSIRKGYNSGLGIVVDNDLVGLDFDNCIKKVNKIEEYGLEIPILTDEVQDIVNKLDNTYIEISQSGKGLHCLVYSSITIPRQTKDKINLEIYAKKSHFMRLSGNVYYDYLGNECNDLLDKTDVLLDIYSKYFNLSDSQINDDTYINNGISFADADFKSQFNGLSNKWPKEDILNNLFKKDIFYYKLYNNNLTTEDIDNYNSKRKGRGLKDTSNSGLSVLLILNLIYYSYGAIDLVYEMFRASKLYKAEYETIKWRAKNLSKLDMIVNYCKSRFRNFKKEELDNKSSE